MAVVKVCRFDILLIALAPSQGAEIKKNRPCLVISPDEMNKYVKTFIIAPMTTRIKRYPTCVPVVFEGKKGSILLDQIRTIDQSKIIKKLGILDSKTASCVLVTLRKMFS